MMTLAVGYIIKCLDAFDINLLSRKGRHNPTEMKRVKHGYATAASERFPGLYNIVNFSGAIFARGTVYNTASILWTIVLSTSIIGSGTVWVCFI